MNPSGELEGRNMMDTATPRSRAIALMREAMTHLEAVDNAQAVLHLERAIDTAECPPLLNLDALGDREAK